MRGFSYKELPPATRRKVRNALINHKIQYTKRGKSNRKLGSDITSKHLEKLLDKVKESTHHSTSIMRVWIKELLKGD